MSRAHRFAQGLAALAAFVEREGRARVPRAHKESGTSLGPWLNNQKARPGAGRRMRRVRRLVAPFLRGHRLAGGLFGAQAGDTGPQPGSGRPESLGCGLGLPDAPVVGLDGVRQDGLPGAAQLLPAGQQGPFAAGRVSGERPVAGPAGGGVGELVLQPVQFPAEEAVPLFGLFPVRSSQDGTPETAGGRERLLQAPELGHRRGPAGLQGSYLGGGRVRGGDRPDLAVQGGPLSGRVGAEGPSRGPRARRGPPRRPGPAGRGHRPARAASEPPSAGALRVRPGINPSSRPPRSGYRGSWWDCCR
ncbi:helicase associated domain-containing protein [Kitasatospora sp. NPDC056531]|uniref:helicase associated domain-containing protein n=1 Tax=Kitasatospora sp. NPDC056531 TaxID=3345856 RepID=UPI0036CE1265